MNEIESSTEKNKVLIHVTPSGDVSFIFEEDPVVQSLYTNSLYKNTTYSSFITNISNFITFGIVCAIGYFSLGKEEFIEKIGVMFLFFQAGNIIVSAINDQLRLKILKEDISKFLIKYEDKITKKETE